MGSKKVARRFFRALDPEEAAGFLCSVTSAHSPRTDAEDDGLRVSVFIDGQNFYRGARNAFFIDDKVPSPCGNFFPDALAELLVARTPGRWLDDTRLYTGIPSTAHNAVAAAAQQSRFDTYKRRGATIRSRPLNHSTDPPREKGIDVLLAIDFLELALDNKFDVAIICSADTDLIPAIEAVRRRRPSKIVEVANWYAPPHFQSMLHVAGVAKHHLTWDDYKAVFDRRNYRTRLLYEPNDADLRPGFTF